MRRRRRREYAPPEAATGGGGRFSPDKAMGMLDGRRQRQLPSCGRRRWALAGGSRAGAAAGKQSFSQYAGAGRQRISLRNRWQAHTRTPAS